MRFLNLLWATYAMESKQNSQYTRSEISEKNLSVEHMLVNDEEAIRNDNYPTKSDQNKNDQQKIPIPNICLWRDSQKNFIGCCVCFETRKNCIE